MIGALVQHVTVSTIFAVLVSAVVWIPKSDSAKFRYAMWLAAALNFAIPTAVFAGLGARVKSFVPAGLIPSSVYPFNEQGFGRLGHGWSQVGNSVTWPSNGVLIVWSLGVMGLFSMWLWQFRSYRLTFIEAPQQLIDMVDELCRRIGLRRRVTVRSPTTGCDLKQYGICESFILVPPSFSHLLDREELEGVLAHELMHVRRWDNLAATIVHLITCVFWFHPGLWWIERRMVVERELACDEGVIDQGWPVKAYTTAILKLCTFRFSEIQAGACGFLGSSLQERMERLMLYKPSASKRTNVILAALGAALMLAPASVGFINAHPIYVQAHREAKPRDASCAFADKLYPEGSIIQQGGATNNYVLWVSVNRCGSGLTQRLDSVGNQS